MILWLRSQVIPFLATRVERSLDIIDFIIISKYLVCLKIGLIAKAITSNCKRGNFHIDIATWLSCEAEIS